MWTLKFVVLLLTLYKVQSDSVCKNPVVKASSYTSSDSTILTEVVFIAEFTLQCDEKSDNLELYAAIGGNVLPVAKIVGMNSKYQVSWTEEVKKATSGEYKINLYDNEGYSLLRRSIRLGEDTHNVKPLVTILLNYPGSYRGPWIHSELVAAIVAIGVWYFAHTSKSKLVS